MEELREVEIKRLMRAVLELSDRILEELARLEEQLAVVMREDSKRPEEPTSEVARTPLGGELSVVRDKLDRAVSTMVDIRDRLEI